MELVELIRGAQDAMDNGDYRLAVAECCHILESYPSCLTAHRMLGEANLEQGQTDEAIAHFERTLAVDPLNVVARLGLGVASEERKEMSRAYAEYLRAWEINPALDQVRDELVRLRGLLGGDERLHPTRAGLAGIYCRGGQFGRAAAEWRAVLQTEPESDRARTSLAEVLWRGGDDVAAAAVARELLAATPDNARALAMLADVEQRRNAPVAAELAQRYGDVDPAGEIVTLLAEWREEVDLGFLRRVTAPLPEFAFVAAPAVPEYAMAGVAALGAAPTPPPPAGLPSGQFGAPDLWDTLVRDLKPNGRGDTALAADVMPFAWLDEGDPAGGLTATAPLGSMSVSSGNMIDLDTPFADMPAPPARGSALDDQLSAYVDSAPPPPMPKPAPAVDAVVEQRPAPVPAANPFVTADGRVDLTVGWDDLDRQLREATPTFDNTGEMDALAASLGVDGIMPFDAGAGGPGDGAWEPFTDDDFGDSSATSAAAPAVAVPELPVVVATAPAPAPAPVPVAIPEPVAAQLDDPGLGFDFDVEAFDAKEFGSGEAAESPWTMDDDLLSAIPAPQASGYTELLRHVDVEVPPPLEFGDDVDPFANPDAAGIPLAFEDLLAVTSRDGTAPLSSAALAEPAGTFGEPAPASVEGSQPGTSGDDLLAGFDAVRPFSLDEVAAAEPTAGAGSGAVDFSDINVPFDPASLPVIAVPPVAPAVPAPAFHVEHASPVVAASAPQPVPVAEPAPVAPAKKGTDGLGLPPGDVAWPTFVNAASSLMDRAAPAGNLFERLRDAKRTAVSAGLLAIDRTLTPPAPVVVELPPAVAAASQVPAAPARSSRSSTLTEAERIDLMALRIRLIEDDGSAGDVASHLEAAIARGLNDPLALRVLGEAYLKLGRMEQAAAQFRQAMLARGRSR